MFNKTLMIFLGIFNIILGLAVLGSLGVGMTSFATMLFPLVIALSVTFSIVVVMNCIMHMGN